MLAVSFGRIGNDPLDTFVGNMDLFAGFVFRK